MKYTNTSPYDLEVIGVGIVATGATIETNEVIENPNLRLLEETVPPLSPPEPVTPFPTFEPPHDQPNPTQE